MFDFLVAEKLYERVMADEKIRNKFRGYYRRDFLGIFLLLLVLVVILLVITAVAVHLYLIQVIACLALDLVISLTAPLIRWNTLKKNHQDDDVAAQN